MTEPVLYGLANMIRTDPALADLIATDETVIAVPDPVRAFALAGFAGLSHPPVMLVAVATAAEAERLEHDLLPFVGSENVVHFPAWETLPFERISPSIETMGQRLSVLHRIALRGALPVDDETDETATLIVVAPVKALMQRLAMSAADAAPIVVSVGDRLDIEDLISDLVARGYRREYQVEHRGEFAVRGGIVDVFPSTGEIGVRIDCFGDEVDRLTSFDLADQRSVDDILTTEIFGCREFMVTSDIAVRAAVCATEVPYARDRFDRIADGEVFDGVESFLPWLVADEQLMPDLLSESDRVVLVEPRRMRDRATELLGEEASLATSLAQTWLSKDDASKLADDAAQFPRLHVAYERIFEHCSSPLNSWLATC